MTTSLPINSSVNEQKMVLSNWRCKDLDSQEWLQANVPGCVHTDLLRNQKISEPFNGKNELDLQWIDKKDWEYETVFDVSEELLALPHLELVFHGLDTYADVYINEQHILSADNMFRTWKADVKSYIKKKDNQLRIHLRSPINEGLVELEQQGYGLPAVNDHSEDGGVGNKKLSVFTRKAPYHYGWDWGPRFVTSGIWKDVELVGWTECRMTDLFIQQKEITSALAKLTARVEVESDASWEGTLVICTEGLTIEQPVALEKGLNQLAVNLEIKDPLLWWSRGLGEPHLYDFSASLVIEERRVAEWSVRTGLRSVKLIREQDAYGKSFYIELNGVPVFAKGANHVPNDSFVTEVTEERYRHEIVSAVEANMNMLRIWGGGIYEYDIFYNLCDEYGILVWQDFMFACSMYPGHEAFYENVQKEAEETIKRLRNHPSIALWCGNNEMDLAWSAYDENGGWGWKQQYSTEIRQNIWENYEKVFHRILPRAVDTYAPGVYYWPSSPMQELTGDENQHASNRSGSGDIHYWDVWHGLKPFEEYNDNVGRFMSEYGFQSFPEYKTIKTYAEHEDMALESDVMLHHQKNDRGNYLIKEYMERYLPKPKDFPSFLYMSQVLQAEGIKTAIEVHRRKKPYCMGTLYWQMNDCWPVASWSSMDYYGRWKALHYYVKKSFRDIHVSIDSADGRNVHIHVITDQLKPVRGNMHVKLSTFKGELLREFVETVNVEANSGKVILSSTIEELVQGNDQKQVLLLVQLEIQGDIIDSKEHYFVSGKEMKLGNPTIKVSQAKGSDGAELILETDTLAKQVYLTTETEGIFSDNYFDLVPGFPKHVRFLSRGFGQTQFQPAPPESLQIRSMVDFI